jgi:hypothetical protein
MVGVARLKADHLAGDLIPSCSVHGADLALTPIPLSSIWVMACRDESPVLTAFSVAYRLRGISPEQVIELVKSRQELFRLGLTRGQSRKWKARYQQAAHSTGPSQGRPTTRRGKAAPKAQE